jgi:hypothetical protein
MEREPEAGIVSAMPMRVKTMTQGYAFAPFIYASRSVVHTLGPPA